MSVEVLVFAKQQYCESCEVSLTLLSLLGEFLLEVLKEVGVEVLSTKMCARRMLAKYQNLVVKQLTLRQWP